MTINTPLLRRTMEQIETHPETWDQANYRCDTGMCFAGWACELSGGTWSTGPDGPLSDYLIAEPDDGEDMFGRWDMRLVTAHNRARRLLGLDGGQADELFDQDNDLDDLRRMVAELCGEAS